MKNILSYLSIGIAVLAGVLIVLWVKPAEEPTITENDPKLELYESEKYGISFTYPKNYILTEREAGDAHRYRYSIVLIDEMNLPLPQNGEGPPAITIDIYQNNLDKQSLMDWLTGTNNSNFKLSDGAYEEIDVDGKPAVAYSWSGLYEADNVALLHKENIISIAVTWLSREDQIRIDFQKILESFELK